MLSAMAQNGPVGFVTYNDLGLSGITGGGAGTIVHVSTRTDFEKYISGTTPYVIILDADITGGGMQDLQDEISLGSNKTLIGAGSGKALNGICLNASGKSNIIIRNIKLTKGRTDGISMRNCHHVWIDHCDLSNSYDGLLDFTLGSSYMTVSWTKLHDHNKVSIMNSGTCHYEDYGKERITFAHCWFANNTQRNPRIGYGLMHIYNCYWTDISSYCIGFHSQAQVLSEYNYFTSTANKAFENQYTTALPYTAYCTDKGSYLDGTNPKKSSSYAYSGISYTPKTYYDYEFDQTDVNSVPTDIQAVGPMSGLQYEPILNPGNGAIEVTATQQLSWGKIDNASSTKMYLGTSATTMQETDPASVSLAPATTYYWQVVATVGGQDYPSPVYQFTTAGSSPNISYPEDKETKTWYRWPSQQYSICTSMPLSWRPAFNAASYNVYLSTSTETLDENKVGNTTALTINPGNLKLGETYYWRVDAVTSGGTTEKGEVWSFSTPKKYWNVGKNETENMYLSGIAFTESGVSDFSGKKGTVGDQGPGAVCGIWNGEAGRYAIETLYRTETTGSCLYAITINNKRLDEWTSATDVWGTALRKTRNTVVLKPGDEIRIEFIAGPKKSSEINEARARLDYVNFVATDKEIIEVTRPSAQPHSPISTKGWDCEYILTSNTIFLDSLGVVGDKGMYQINDDYCPWMTYNHPKKKVVAYKGVGYVNPATDKAGTITLGYSPALTTSYSMDIYVKDVAMAKFYYTGKSDANGAVKLTYHEINGTDSGEVVGLGSTMETSGYVTAYLDKGKQYKLTLIATAGVQLLYAGKLYKVVPSPFTYYEPVADAGSDHQLIWSPDMIFKDTQGTKGDKDQFQIRDGYDKWCDYYNPDANNVQAKEENSTAVYYLNPLTDKSCSKTFVTGKAGTHACYIAGTKKSMTYYLQNTKKIKYYYTGSGGAAKALHLVIKENGLGDGTIIQGPAAAGKSKVSNCVEAELDPTKKYTVTIIADSNGGDMLIYATKLWSGQGGKKGDANNDGGVDVADITAIASHILGQTPIAWNATNANANSDNTIDVADITATATIILSE